MSRPIRILVVEDSDDDAELAILEFEQAGYDPRWQRVETPEAMRTALIKEEWDIIISDYSMPHFSGPEALKLVQEQELDIPFIIVSGTVGEDIAVESMKAGAHDYLLKSSKIRLVPAVEREIRDAKVRQERRQAYHYLNKRVKELECLYSIAMISDRPDVTIDEVCQDAVNVIPPGWQYPDITCARITIDGKKFLTPNFRKTIWKQNSDIIIDGQIIGSAEVFYLEKKPVSDEGPFLKEERNLINSIARQLGCFIQHKRVEVVKDNLFLMLQTIRNVNRLIVREKNRERMLKSICDIFTRTRGCRFAWVALLDDSGRFITAVGSGWRNNFLPMIHQLKQGKLPDCGQKALKKSTIVITEKSSPNCTGCSLEKKECNQRTMTTRLEHKGKIYGLLSATLPDRFLTEPEEYSLFEEVAEDIAFALYTIELEVERKMAEKALRKNELKYRTLTENVNIGIYRNSIGEKGKFIEVNPAFLNIFGYDTKEELFRLDVASLYLDPKDRLDFNNKLVVNGFINNEELLLKKKDGSTIVCLVSASIIKDKKGEIIFFDGIIEDISERKRAEEEQKRLISAIEQAADSIIITDQEATILYVNPAFERLTAYRQEEVVGQNPSILKSGKQDEIFYKEMWDTLKSGDTWRGEIINKSKEGTLFTEETSISPVFDSGGKIINYIGVKHDVTKQRILEAQLIQAQKMETVGRLAGGVAHDFNNMLSVILGYAELLIDRIDMHDPMLKELIQIQKAGQRSADITHQLLAFSRKQVIELKIVNLNPMVADMKKMLGRLLGEDIDLSFIPSKNLWDTKVDQGQINQIVVNLGVNARDAMLTGGKLTIETSNVIIDKAYCQGHTGFVPGNYVMLAVSDNGTGMDKEIQSHIFEPFYTTKEKGKGTGLGLATVYGIIKQNNGFINVYSELGYGTTFKLYFPQCVEKDNKKEIAIEAHKVFVSGTILLTEDNKMVRNLTSKILKIIGYNVLVAETPHDALAQCRKGEMNIDLLLTDVVMPQMSGQELKESIEAIIPEIKTLFMSGYTTNVISHHGILDKGINFIQKPFTKAGLARKVLEVLEQ